MQNITIAISRLFLLEYIHITERNKQTFLSSSLSQVKRFAILVMCGQYIEMTLI